MTPTEALSLISPARISRSANPTRWVDLGSGSGLFTLALSRLLPEGSTIYGIDNAGSVAHQTTPNGVGIIPLHLDFVRDDWGLQNLDGILMANALHYVKDKTAFLAKAQRYLNPSASFLIVEYDTDTPVPTWVPYPLSFSSLTKLFAASGYPHIEKSGQRPSVYHSGNLYAALIRP